MSAAPKFCAAADPDVLAVLREILAELRGLRSDLAAIEQRRTSRPLSHADANALATLLPTINAALPNVTFSTRLLRDYATLNGPPFIALREALTSVGGSRTVGRLLRRGVAGDVPGFQIEAVGKNSEGRLWSLSEVGNVTIETHNNSRQRVTGGARKT